MLKRIKALERAMDAKQGEAIEAEVVTVEDEINNIWARFQCCHEMRAHLRSKSNRQAALAYMLCPYCGEDAKSDNNEVMN